MARPPRWRSLALLLVEVAVPSGAAWLAVALATPRNVPAWPAGFFGLLAILGVMLLAVESRYVAVLRGRHRDRQVIRRRERSNKKWRARCNPDLGPNMQVWLYFPRRTARQDDELTCFVEHHGQREEAASIGVSDLGSRSYGKTYVSPPDVIAATTYPKDFPSAPAFPGEAGKYTVRWLVDGVLVASRCFRVGPDGRLRFSAWQKIRLWFKVLQTEARR